MQIWTWGINDNYALGRKTDKVIDPNNPGEYILVEELETMPMVLQDLADQGFRAVDIAAGASHSIALGHDGTLRAWGTFSVCTRFLLTLLTSNNGPIFSLQVVFLVLTKTQPQKIRTNSSIPPPSNPSRATASPKQSADTTISSLLRPRAKSSPGATGSRANLAGESSNDTNTRRSSQR